MADSTRPTIETIWANAADPVNVVEPSTAKQNAGWGEEQPPLQTFNWFWNKLCNLFSFSEKNGILPWKSTTSYSLNGLCMGSDGRIYQSQQATNANHEPIGDNGTWWKDWIDRVSDVEYVKLTAGTLPLIQTATGTYTYNIADFVGTGLSVSDIRGIWVESKCRTNLSSSEVFAEAMGVEVSLCWCAAFGEGDATATSTFMMIPIEKGQDVLKMRISIVSGSDAAQFKIIGAAQRAR
jgi:hypothetical protein